MVRPGLLPVGEGAVSQLGAAAVAVALGGQGSQGLAPALTHQRTGVSLLIIILETNIWILDIVETHRKLTWLAILPAEHLMIGLGLVPHITDAGVGPHAQGLNTRTGEIESGAVIERDDIGIDIPRPFVFEDAVSIEGLKASAHELAAALSPDQQLSHGCRGERGRKLRSFDENDKP